jgi:hypothetical protein
MHLLTWYLSIYALHAGKRYSPCFVPPQPGCSNFDLVSVLMTVLFCRNVLIFHYCYH